MEKSTNIFRERLRSTPIENSTNWANNMESNNPNLSDSPNITGL